MIYPDTILHACIVDDEGTVLLPLRWGNTGAFTDWRFFLLQMWDEAEQPIARPVPVSPEYLGEVPADHWCLDLQDLPPGLRVVELDPEDWAETQADKHLKRYDHGRGRVVVQDWAVRTYPTVTTVMQQQDPLCHRRYQLPPDHAGHVVRSHWAHGGMLCYRVPLESPKDERDFPHLPFTHVTRWRKHPVTAAEEAARTRRLARYVKGAV